MSDDLIRRSVLLKEINNFSMRITGSVNARAITIMEETRRSIVKMVEEQPAAYESDICEPEYLEENRAIGCRIGRCRCGNIVRSYHNFCNDCGIKLEWGNVWPESMKVQNKICPKCGREFERLLAVSRADNKTMICNDCGIIEALDSVPQEILTPQERTRIAVAATGNRWAMENFNATHN